MTSCFKNLKNHIKLSGISSIYFYKSAWDDQVPENISTWYLIYRTIFLVYFLFCIIASICRDKILHLWLIWATNLSLLGQTLYALIYFTNIFLRVLQQKRRTQSRQLELNFDVELTEIQIPASSPPLNTLDSITWLILNVAGTIPFIVTLGYWLFVFDPKKRRESLGWDLTGHGVNALLALVDIFIINIPIRLAHGLYTLIFVLLYLLFSAIYEYAGGVYRNEEEPYIYGLLNWRQKPLGTLLNCFVALIAALGLQSCLWILFKLRIYLVGKLKPK